MLRRTFINKFSISLSIASLFPLNSFSKNTFNLNYAPHLGMFKNTAVEVWSANELFWYWIETKIKLITIPNDPMISVTAGNSSQMSDGAAFVVVMSGEMIKKLNLQPIARMVYYATAGVEPSIMGIGPAEAVPKALKFAGLKLSDIDQIELNEAFAAQALSVIKALDFDKEKVNVNGGAVALGHPLGMTGAKLSIQLINELKRRKQKYGIVTACVGGGQGVCGVFENL